MENLGTIKEIQEVENISLKEESWCKFDGYKVVTDKHSFFILISSEQNCCESWGYFSSEDNFEQFIEKGLKEVTATNTALNTAVLEKENDIHLDEGGIQFVNFVCTDGSVLQFAVYNGHNGYYGHSIYFMKDDEVLLEESL